jgi:glycosyltransferase involved in cell wall biosynthesis
MFKHNFPKVTILMCTFNGEDYIKDQLDSFQCQTYKNWSLIVSDDGSRDKTLRILNQYKKKWGAKKIKIVKGPQQGFSVNFMSLLQNKKYRGDYFFVSDQDDIWMPKKIEDYLTIFDKRKEVSLIGGSSIYIDHKLSIIGKSLTYKHKPCFSNALLQSMFGGNTISINARFKKQIESMNVKNIPSYDWFLYITNSLIGNYTYYMKEPKIFYRQHPNALVGGNVGFKSILKRFFLFSKGFLRDNISKNIDAIKEVKLSTKYNLLLLEEFILLRDGSLLERIKILCKFNFNRYGNWGLAVIVVGSILRKI